jgi:hypothetical protein
VTFNSTTAAQAINGTAASQTFKHITVNKTGRTLSVGGSTTTLTLNGTMTLTAGTLDAGTASAVNIAGNWTNNSGGAAFDAGSSTVVFNGGTSQTLGGSASTIFNNLAISNAADTTQPNYKTVGVAIAVSGTLTINSGNTLDMQSFSGSSFGAGSTNNGKIRWSGSNVFVSGTGMTEFYSSSAGSIAAGATYGNIHISGSNKSVGAGVSVTATGGNAAFGVTVNGSLSVATTGVLTVDGMNLNINGPITNDGTVTVQ